jgi:hypothetical protein
MTSMLIDINADRGTVQGSETNTFKTQSPEAYCPINTLFFFAFEDKNEDATFQPDEWAGWYGDPSPLTATAGDVYRNLTLTLSAPVFSWAL